MQAVSTLATLPDFDAASLSSATGAQFKFWVNQTNTATGRKVLMKLGKVDDSDLMTGCALPPRPHGGTTSSRSCSSHYHGLKGSLMTDKGSFPLIAFFDMNMIISPSEIFLGEPF